MKIGWILSDHSNSTNSSTFWLTVYHSISEIGKLRPTRPFLWSNIKLIQSNLLLLLCTKRWSHINNNYITFYYSMISVFCQLWLGRNLIYFLVVLTGKILPISVLDVLLTTMKTCMSQLSVGMLNIYKWQGISIGGLNTCCDIIKIQSSESTSLNKLWSK